MMTTRNSKFLQVKKILELPTVFALAFLFMQKTYASERREAVSTNNTKLKISASSPIPNEEGILPYLDNAQPKVIKNGTIKPSKKSSVEKTEVPPTIASSTNTNTTSYIAPPPPPTSALLTVDVLPEFPGGLNEFRNIISKNFDSSIFENQNGLLKTEVYFVVENNGTISEITAGGENEKFNIEAVRATKASSSSQKWKPAMKDGKAVRYRYVIPMSMSFAGSKN